jgi:regulatory protein
MNTELLKYAYYLLGRKDYTVQEISEKLRRKFAGASDSDIDLVIDKLIDLRIISDEKFTEIYIRNGLSKNWGKSRIKFNLKRKGVSNEIIDKYLFCDNFKIDIDNLYSAIFRKYKIDSYENLTSDEKYNILAKIKRYLAYRGHSFDDIEKVIKKITL